MTKFYKPTDVAQMEMDNTSDSQLGAQVAKALRPGLKQNISARLQQTKQNRAALDADAAARGMGSSTWLTDVKNRAKNNEASDIASINSAYQQNLYQNLQDRINNRNQRNQVADQFNKAALNQLYQTAMAQASQWGMYDKQQEAAASRGGGGGGGGGYVWDLKTASWVPKKSANGDYLTEKQYGNIMSAPTEERVPAGSGSSSASKVRALSNIKKTLTSKLNTVKNAFGK